jgi:tryptophanyl-tRNA synthetase
MDILVSAHNPMTGPRHLGHYVSTMMEWPDCEKNYECFFVIDDLIATFMYPKVREDILNRTLLTARDFLACGIDPNKSHLVFTSMLWENTELLLLLSNFVDTDYCKRLFEHSFLGMLAPHMRAQLELPTHASVAEFLYPQLGIPSLTIGLQAKAFQGGEEISGYVHIMKEIGRRFANETGERLTVADWLPPRTAYLCGSDSTHMSVHNALCLTEPPSADELSALPDSVLQEWAVALEGTSYADALAKNPTSARDEIIAKIALHCEPFKNCCITSDEILDHAAKGASRAKFLLRQTLGKVKAGLRIPEIIEY